ncbi:MAG: hypothetical protein AAGL17_13445, partial [Cyanobacteria bacterium J06576_12]
MADLQRQSKSSLRSRTFSSLSIRSTSSLQRTSQQADGPLRKPVSKTLTRPLIHILDYGERPGDMVSKPKQVALHGQKDVYIARAEIELRNAMQSLAFMTNSEINSISTLTALSLPKAV